MKKIIALLIIILCSWLIAYYPYLMVNPGPLVKGHQEIKNKCLSCHQPFWGISTQKCIACHNLSDIGRDTIAGKDSTGKKITLFHQNLKDQECNSCHTDHRGINAKISARTFNHDQLSKSEKNNCNKCHDKPTDNTHKPLATSCNNCHNTNGWKSGVIFDHSMIEGTDKNNCHSCHQAPADAYHGSFKDNCSKCHNTTGWKSGVTFNHNMIASADLTNCSKCHHAPADNYHTAFKDNCSKCHTTNQWKPSTFDHSAYFQLDEHHNAQCNTCHTGNNYRTYTCFGCHEHSAGDINGEHREHGMSNISNCVSCHKSGNEHEDGEHSGNRNGEGHEGGDD